MLVVVQQDLIQHLHLVDPVVEEILDLLDKHLLVVEVVVD